MQKWAMELVMEAERIERQYRAVGKWRDPLGESLERVLPRESVAVKSAKVKGEFIPLDLCYGTLVPDPTWPAV